MLCATTLDRLLARCPPWLWPVLFLSLVSLREQVRLLAALGASGWEIRLTWYGRAHIAHVWWPGDPDPWKDSLYRTAMGEPVAAPTWHPEPLGILTDETQVGWVLGLAGRDEIPPATAGKDTTARRHTTAGGMASRPSQDLARAPPNPLHQHPHIAESIQTPPQPPLRRTPALVQDICAARTSPRLRRKLVAIHRVRRSVHH